MAGIYNTCTKFYLLIGAVETEIREPINWGNITISLKRDPKYYGVNFEFSGGDVLLQFDCVSGKDLLDSLYQTNGNDSEAWLLFDEVDSVGARTNLFTGKIDFNTYECEEFVTSLAVKRVYFGDLLRSRFNVETSFSSKLSLDGNAVQSPDFRNIELHSKAIVKDSLLVQSEDEFVVGSTILEFSIPGGLGSVFRSGQYYLQWGFDTQERDDLQNTYFLPSGWSLAFPDAWIYDAAEAGSHTINLALEANLFIEKNNNPPAPPLLACGGDGGWNEVLVKTYLRHTTFDGITIMDYLIRQDAWTDAHPACHNDPSWTISYDETYTNTFDIEERERLYLFTEYTVSGDYNEPIIGPRLLGFNATLLPYQKTSFLEISATTLTEPSTAPLMFVHEALSKLTANITGTGGAIKSDFFGRPNILGRTYPANGCGALIALGSGLAIRGFDVDEKPTSKSLQSLMDDLQAIYNVGFQLDTESITKQFTIYARRYSTLTELETRAIYDAPINPAHTYSVIFQTSALPDLRTYSGELNIYLDEVLTYTLSVDEISVSDSQVGIIGFERLRIEPVNIVDGGNTDFASITINALYTGSEESVLIVEPFDFFFNEDEVLVIDSFENYTEEVAKDWIFNSVSVGYGKWENEEVNGLDEFATKQQNLLPIATKRSEKTAISETVASGYAIEFTRRLRLSTEDSSYDKELFAVQMMPDGFSYRTEKDEPFDIVTGIIDPATAYNLRLSPKRNLLNWSSYLNGCLFYKQLAEKLTFTAGEGNTELATQFNILENCRIFDINRIELQERGNILLSDFGGKASPIRPEICKFRTKISWDELQLLKANPYGYISITGTIKGDVKGYILDVQYSPDIEAGWTDFTLIKKAE